MAFFNGRARVFNSIYAPFVFTVKPLFFRGFVDVSSHRMFRFSFHRTLSVFLQLAPQKVVWGIDIFQRCSHRVQCFAAAFIFLLKNALFDPVEAVFEKK